MDWIERLLGFAPDAGDGSLERSIGLTIAAGIGAIAAVIVARRRSHRPS